MDGLTLKTTEIEGVLVIQVIGYVSMETCGRLHDAVEPYLVRGGRSVVLDFTDCKIVNSPGTAALMTMTMRVNDDFCGRVAIVVPDPVKVTLFELAGVFPMADRAVTLDEAVRLAKNVR